MHNIDWQDDRDIYGRMLVLTNNPLFNNLRNAMDNYNADLTDALSWGQLKSKRWLINELERLDLDLGTVYLCAGWYATLAQMLFLSNCNVNKIRSFDVDDLCMDIADCLNKDQLKDSWKFKAITQDIHEINFNEHTWQTWSKANNRMSKPITDTPDTIINTSCEHIENFSDWYNKIPSEKLVVLQNNDYVNIEDHINCVNSLEEFAESTPMANVLYEGKLELSKYTRFMRIGLK